MKFNLCLCLALVIVLVISATTSSSMLRKLKIENKSQNNASAAVNFTSGSRQNYTIKKGKTVTIKSNKSGKSYDYISAYTILSNTSSVNSNVTVTNPGSAKEAKYKIDKNGTIHKK